MLVDYLSQPVEYSWTLMGLGPLQVLPYLSTIHGMTSGQAQFQLANSFDMPESLLRNFVVLPSKRETVIWRAASSSQHIIKCI
jgi:hypothetical protein